MTDNKIYHGRVEVSVSVVAPAKSFKSAIRQQMKDAAEAGEIDEPLEAWIDEEERL